MEEAAKDGKLNATMMYQCLLASVSHDIDCYATFLAAQLLRDVWIFGDEIQRIWPDFVHLTNLAF